MLSSILSLLSVLWLAVVVGPGVELLEDPCGQADRRVRERVAEGLRSRRLLAPLAVVDGAELNHLIPGPLLLRSHRVLLLGGHYLRPVGVNRA